MVAEHLIERGHRRLAVVVNQQQSPGVGRRVGGFISAARAAGLAEVVRLPALPTMLGGSALGDVLLDQHPQVSGVFAYNDLVAAGLIAALRRRGVRVPADVAVVGCDDIQLAEVWEPPLTTIRVGPERVGEIAARHVLSLLGAGDPLPEQERIGVELVVRGSS